MYRVISVLRSRPILILLRTIPLLSTVLRPCTVKGFVTVDSSVLGSSFTDLA